jgi:hypothetical protein
MNLSVTFCENFWIIAEIFRVYILLIEINYCRNCHLLHVADILHVDQSCKNWHNILVNFGCSCLLLHGGYFKETTAPIH